MEIFEKNIKALEKNYPYIAKFFLSYDYCEDNEMINVEVRKIEEKNILVVNSDGKLYQLDSLYDENAFCSMWYERIDKKINLDCKHIMFGFGNGKLVRTFLERAPEDNRLIVCEYSKKIFYVVLNNYDIADVLSSDRMTLIIPGISSNGNIRRLLLDQLVYADLGTAYAFVHNNYDRILKDECQEFLIDADRVFSTLRANNDLLALRGQLIHENIKSNMKFLIRSKQLADLKGICSGLPGIIVSAGPSLNKNVKELKAAENKAVIIAVDSAIRTLEAANIKPDLIVAVDPRKGAKYLDSNNCNGIPLVTCLHANSGFICNHDGIQFFEDTFEPFIQTFMAENRINFLSVETGGSVATTAFSIARYMGCKTIILVGQDLAYTDDKTHAAESADSIRTVEELEGNLIDVDIYGKPIKTSADMRRYKEWFEQIISDNKPLKVYDATEGGAYIKGSEVITLRKVIEKECRALSEVCNKIKEAADLFDDIQKDNLVKWIKKMPKALDDNREILRKVLFNYSKMLSLVNTNKYRSKEFISLSRKSNEMLSTVENDPFMEFAMKTCYSETNEINQNINHIESDEREELRSVIEISIKYANIIKEAIDNTMSDAIEMADSLESV